VNFSLSLLVSLLDWIGVMLTFHLTSDVVIVSENGTNITRFNRLGFLHATDIGGARKGSRSEKRLPPSFWYVLYVFCRRPLRDRDRSATPRRGSSAVNKFFCNCTCEDVVVRLPLPLAQTKLIDDITATAKLAAA